MTVDDRTRLNLHRKLTELLGPEEADTLMAHLPPVTWDQVATRSDLEAQTELLRAELRSEVGSLRSDLRAEFTEAMNRQIKWLVTFAAAWTTVLLTAAQLIG